jgi:hypothetical protein
VQAAAAARTALALAPRAAAQPLAMPALAASLAASALGPGAAAQVIVVGPAGHPGREELMDAAWGAPFAAGTRAVLRSVAVGWLRRTPAGTRAVLRSGAVGWLRRTRR